MKLWLAHAIVRTGAHRLLLRILAMLALAGLLIAVSLCGALSAGLQASTLAWPVPIPAAGDEHKGWQAGGWHISSRFGWRENPLRPGSLEFHDGIDLAGPPFDLNRPAVAVFDAQVRYVGWDQPHAAHPAQIGGGQLVILQNGDGEMEALYAHLQSYRLYIQLQGRLDNSDQYAPVGTAGLLPEPLDASIDTTCVGAGATFVPTRISPGTYLLLYDRPAECTTTVTWPPELGWSADGPARLRWNTPVDEGMLAKDVALRFRGRLATSTNVDQQTTASHIVARGRPRPRVVMGHLRTGGVTARAIDTPAWASAWSGTPCRRRGTQTRCHWLLGDIPDRVEQGVPAAGRPDVPPLSPSIEDLQQLYPGIPLLRPRLSEGAPAGDIVIPSVHRQAEHAPAAVSPRRPVRQYGPPVHPISVHHGLQLVAHARAQAPLQQAEQGAIDTSAPCYIAAQAALSKQGARYSQGGHLPGDPIDPRTGTYYPRTGPDSFDCSGLTWWAYRQAGISIGSVVSTQAVDGVRIPCTLADLRGKDTTCWAPGDLILLAMPGIGPSHVAIYVGSGLFMDCYNHAVNCILHEVQHDWAYRTYFWQARRYANGCADHVLPIPPPSAGWDGGGMLRQPVFTPGGPCVHGIPTFQQDVETFSGCGPPLAVGTTLKMLDSRAGYIGLSGATTGPHLHVGLTQIGLSGQPTTTDVCTDAWLQGRTPPPGHVCTTRQADPLDFLPRAHATAPLAAAKDAPAVDEPYQLPPPGTDGALLAAPEPEASPPGEYWSPYTETGRFGGGSLWERLWCWLVPFASSCSHSSNQDGAAVVDWDSPGLGPGLVKEHTYAARCATPDPGI